MFEYLRSSYLSGRPGKAKRPQISKFNDITAESYQMGGGWGHEYQAGSKFCLGNIMDPRCSDESLLLNKTLKCQTENNNLNLSRWISGFFEAGVARPGRWMMNDKQDLSQYDSSDACL